MDEIRVLTGITTTGSPHLGNYVGAIRPAIRAAQRPGVRSFYFLADYHALVKCEDPERVQRSTLEIAATWLALGLDPERVHFYRQSDLPEIPELMWILTCLTGKGLLNRAHAYKDRVDDNRSQGLDPDHAINAGLFMYPVLMAADILIFNAHQVPVGRDQIQHLEIARDLAQRFNHVYGPLFTLPEAQVDEHSAVLPGLDGRKMSKSYDNTIPLWLPAPKLREAIFRIVTNTQAPGEPKNPADSTLFMIFQAFADPDEVEAMRQAYAEGIGWGEVKQRLFERIDRELAPARARYEGLIAAPEQVEAILRAGAERARPLARATLARARERVGLRPLHGSAATARRPSKERSARDKPPRLLRYREADGQYYGKLLAGDGTVLLISRGQADPKSLAALLERLLHGAELRVGATSVEAVDTAGAVLAEHPAASEPGQGVQLAERIRAALTALAAGN